MREIQSFLDVEEGDQKVLQGVIGFFGAFGTLFYREIEGTIDQVGLLS